MPTPKISFMVCTHNRENCAKQCINNLLRLKNINLEVIVRDNASTDNTKEVITNIKDDRLKYYRSDYNTGTFNFYQISKLATGDIITWLSDEEDCDLDNILKVIDIFDKNPDCNALLSSVTAGRSKYKTIRTNNKITNIMHAYLTALRFTGCAGVFIRNSSLKDSPNLNVTDTLSAYRKWNYYPLGFLAATCIKDNLYTSSLITAIQTRFEATTNNWCNTVKNTSNELLPHYYPISIYDKIKSEVLYVLETNIGFINKLKFVYHKADDFKFQITNAQSDTFISLLKDNYSDDIINRYKNYLIKHNFSKINYRRTWVFMKKIKLYLLFFAPKSFVW